MGLSLSWNAYFSDPISLASGIKLTTLRAAGAYISILTKNERDAKPEFFKCPPDYRLFRYRTAPNGSLETGAIL